MREDPDKVLLLRDPSALILKYRDTIRIIVLQCAGPGLAAGEPVTGMVNTVMSELMLRMPAIQANYNGSSLVRTYLSAVARNVCRQLRGNKPAEKSLDDVSHRGLPFTSIHDRFSINQARGAFRAVLLQHDRDLPKLLVCLKVRYRIRIAREDLLRWQPDCEEAVITDFFEKMQSWPEKLTDRQVFARSAPFLNRLQRKETTDDTIRRWAASRIAGIADALEGAIPGARFDAESIRILAEDYFSPYLLRD